MTVHLTDQSVLEAAIRQLVKDDPRLKPILAKAGMPALRQRAPGFEGLAQIVCGQQVSVAAAAAIWGRVSGVYVPFDHHAIRKARTDRLGRLGLSAAKIKTLKAIAKELVDERLNLDVLAEEDADAAHNTLIALHGIGPWTADVYLLFCLGHGDAWPAGDVAIQEAIKVGLGLEDRPTVKQMAPLAEPWRPLRGAAAHLWWAYYHAIKQFNVGKANLATTSLMEPPLPSRETLPDDGLLVKVDRFAFTANNITYAMLGDAMKYWQLFPAPDGFGNIPVWGFGEVVASKHPQIEEGERLFGYFPMATHLVIEAADVSTRGFRDAAAHRQSVAPVYNAYARVSANPAFSGRNGDHQALLRALFMLSFLVDDYLAEAEFFGAKQVILSSASSKTAFGLAHLLHGKRQPIRVIGLTSPGNADFTASLGCYHEVVPYDRIESLPPEQPTAFVDMAGNADLRGRLHRHFSDRLVYSGRVGMTHQDTAETGDLPGAKPSWFFAPDQIRKRAKEWGPGGIDQRFGAAWADFLPMLETSLTIVEGFGVDAVERVYRETLAGRVSPSEGHMLSLFER